MHEETSKNCCKWIEALFDAEKMGIKQGKHRLGSDADGFCCLGIGCKALDIPFRPSQVFSTAFAKSVGLLSSDGAAYNIHPDVTEIPICRMMPSGGYVTLDNPCVSFHPSYVSCAGMNDNKDMGFGDIALHLVNNAKNYFTPAVAEAVVQHFAEKKYEKV
jgi:hypothetical protein